MSRGLKLLSFALVLAVAVANCPNSCSGAGTCGANDKCTCYPNYQGLDCSERVCPYQIGFADVASADNAAHAYMECSGKGSCDRKSGTCKCFAGYEGEACRRTVCPNSCSGHGTCELMSEIAADSNANAGGASGRVFNTWESAKHQVCKCDPYWGGVDCSGRECPKGDDPLTTGGVSEQQTIVITGSASLPVTKFFTLTFEDTFGGYWTTRPLAHGAADDTQMPAKYMELALNGLPNQVIKGATVVVSRSTHVHTFIVTFGAFNSGDQNMLTVNTAGCEIKGCNPLFVGTTTASAAVTQSRASTSPHEHATCSNRGSCDSATGLCSCHSGYYGESCAHQTALF